MVTRVCTLFPPVQKHQPRREGSPRQLLSAICLLHFILSKHLFHLLTSWPCWTLIDSSVCSPFLTSNPHSRLVIFLVNKSQLMSGCAQDLLQLRIDLPLSSGQEDLRSGFIGETSRKAIAFLMKRDRLSWHFLWRVVLSFSFFLPGKVSKLPGGGAPIQGACEQKPHAENQRRNREAACVLMAQERCLTSAACLWTYCDARNIKPI